MTSPYKVFDSNYLCACYFKRKRNMVSEVGVKGAYLLGVKSCSS